MLDLKKIYVDYHSSAKAFSDLCPWMSMVEQDMVVNTDGSLLVCYSFDGIDAEGLLKTDSDRYANLLEQALRVGDDHMIMWSIIDRRKIYDFPESYFASEIGSAINERWKKEFTTGDQYANKHYLCFLYSPAKGSEGFFESIAYHLKTNGEGMWKAFIDTFKTKFSKDVAIQAHFEQLESMKIVFYSKLREFEETLVDLGFQRLINENLLAFLHSRCSPASAGQPVEIPPVPAYLNTWLPDNTLHRMHDHLIFEDNQDCYVGAFTVKRWPNTASPGIIDGLLSVPAELTVSQIFRFMDNGAAKSLIEEYEEHHRNASKSVIAVAMESWTNRPSEQIDSGRLALAEDAQEAIVELTLENKLFGFYNMTVLGYGNSALDLEENMKYIATSLRQRGFILTRETLHLLSSFTATLPGQYATNCRWSMMNIGNVADLAMIRTLSVGEKINRHLTEQTRRAQQALTVFSTEFSTPFFFSFHQSDLAHTLVLGPAGAGKTSIVNFLISQFEKHTPCNRIIFDKDYSCMIPTLLQDGRHIDMDKRNGSKVKLNPFSLLKSEKNIRWLIDFVKVLIQARGYVLKTEDDQDLLRAMQSLQKQPPEFWCLSHYVTSIGNRQLAEQFGSWVKGGINGDYFDNTADEFEMSSFVAIELGAFDDDVAAPFMEYAFFRVNEMLDGRPTLIYIEECWFMLKNKVFAERINDWLKTLRKRNAFVIMATQSLNDIAKSEIFSSIIDNIQNRIYLANPNAYANIDLYTEKFQLNEAQVDRIANAIPKQQYYIVTPKYSRMVNAKFPKEVMACLAADERSKSVFRRHYNEGKGAPNWQFNYVEERIQ